jgi:hypothetical protein
MSDVFADVATLRQTILIYYPASTMAGVVFPLTGWSAWAHWTLRRVDFQVKTRVRLNAIEIRADVWH